MSDNYSEPYDRSHQEQRYKLWRLKVGIATATKNMPTSVKAYQMKVHKRKLSVKDACRMLEDNMFDQAVKRAQLKAMGPTESKNQRYFNDLE